MRNWMVRTGAVVLVIGIVLGVVGGVSAQDDPSPPQQEAQDRWQRQLLGAVAEATGLEPQVVLAQLREGQTLAQVCEANGVDPQAVIDDVKAAITADIEQAVADGKMTEGRANQVLGRLGDALIRVMNAQLQNRSGVQHPVATQIVRELVNVLAEQVSVRPVDIIEQARDGLTAAEIATAAGLDPQAIMDATLAHISEHLEQMVTEGRITQEQMDNALTQAADLLPEMMNHSLEVGDRNPVLGRARERAMAVLVDVLAEAVGVDPRELLREALAPPSLAEVAEAHGLDLDTLISTAEARITEEIEQAVTDGNLSPEQADQLLAGLHDWLVERFDAPFRLPAQRNNETVQPG